MLTHVSSSLTLLSIPRTAGNTFLAAVAAGGGDAAKQTTGGHIREAEGETMVRPRDLVELESVKVR